MKAMLLTATCDLKQNKMPLTLAEKDIPEPTAEEVLIKVSACGVCHTELDEIEGRMRPPVLPLVPGHQVVGVVVAAGREVRRHRVGDRLGVAWIYSACGRCHFCRAGNENLCADFKATGRDVDGGYAEYMVVGEDFAYGIPERFSDIEAAPLLCAGAIGYRSLRLAGISDGQNLGLTGFGASAHLVLKMARYQYPGSDIFVFARSEQERAFARELGAVWAGDTEEVPPVKLQAVIDTTPAWKPILEALKNIARGGRLVINAIRKEKSDQDYLLKLSYPEHLWLEKEIKSVANVTRRDVTDFLDVAAAIPIRPEVQIFSLEEANHALSELKARRIKGAKVLKIN